MHENGPRPGLDDYEGPPEGYRGPIRVHNGHQWLGSCRELVRIVPDEQAAPPLVLRNLVPSDRLRAALDKGTRRALDLGEAVLEIRDDHGALLAEQVLWPRISTWLPPSHGSDLVDLELVAAGITPVPDYARPIWERWFTGPPEARGAWAGLDTRQRTAWLHLVRERGCRHPHRDRPPGHAYVLDGRHVTDEPGLSLALGEAVNGPGGYFGGGPDALADCLYGSFGYTAPATLLWHDASTAREHLSQGLVPEGPPCDLFTGTLEVLAERGMRVTLA